MNMDTCIHIGMLPHSMHTWNTHYEKRYQNCISLRWPLNFNIPWYIHTYMYVYIHVYIILSILAHTSDSLIHTFRYNYTVYPHNKATCMSTSNIIIWGLPYFCFLTPVKCSPGYYMCSIPALMSGSPKPILWLTCTTWLDLHEEFKQLPSQLN